MSDAVRSEAGGMLVPNLRYDAVTQEIARIPLAQGTRQSWWIGFALSSALVALLIVSIAVLFFEGVGVWGVNIPVNWGLAIANTVWWIGIGHAGTFISSMLLLTQQGWRNSLNRFAEAMTLFAVLCALLYPILHLGRPFYFYFMAPYPSSTELWPQFRSPLVWDFFAIATYLIVSALFWYVGLIPDLASVRDRAKRRVWQVFFGVAALGWRGSARHWVRWRRSYMLIAALAMPLVVSVHSGVAMLFAAGPVPGWHTTIFPPYFVLGAVFSGFAVVAMIAVILRQTFQLHSLITCTHLHYIGLFLLGTGIATLYGYVFEAFGAWYAGGHELETLIDRLAGDYAPVYWAAIALNFAPLQLMWLRRFREDPKILFLVGLSATVGMWFERYMLVMSALYQDYLPSAYGTYSASFWEWTLFAGLLGLFLWLFFLFVRLVPAISITEVKEVVYHERRRRRQEGRE